MKKFNSIVRSTVDSLAVISFLMMTIITVIGVFFRYALDNPIIWAEEVSRYFMVWGIMLGTSIVTRKNAQLGIDIFTELTPPAIQKIIKKISYSLLIILFGLLAVVSVQFLLHSIRIGNVAPIIRIKMYWIYAALPIGFILSTYEAILLFMNQFTDSPVEVETIEEDEVFI